MTEDKEQEQPEVNIFDAPWPLDLIKPQRTLGEAMMNIAEAILDEKPIFRLTADDNGFENWVTLTVTVPSTGRAESTKLTPPKISPMEHRPGMDHKALARMLEKDLKALCEGLKK